MEKGIWKKYDCEPENWDNEAASYQRLYNDLKGSNVSWRIAKSKHECMDELCGEKIPYYGTGAGDIYVYYHEEDGKQIPEFYIKVMKIYDLETKCEKNFILFNGASLGYDGINNEYLPILIAKLCEIDEEKNAKFIKELEERYKNYQRLLFLKSREEYTEEELIFIYLMAYKNNSELALELLSGRNIQVDFDSLSDENKANLFVIIHDNQISEQLSITSKEVLLILAQKGSLKQLNNTTEEIINDSNFIKELLTEFLKAKNALNHYELDYHLPAKYQSDFNFLKLIIQSSAMNSLILWKWIQNNPELKEKLSNPDFVYELMDLIARTYMNNNARYPKYMYYLACFPESIVEHIEDHLLVGPEPTALGEQFKKQTLTLIQEEKKLVLTKK